MHPLEIQPTTRHNPPPLPLLSYLLTINWEYYPIWNSRKNISSGINGSSLPNTSLETPPPRERDNLAPPPPPLFLANVFFVPRVFSDWVARSNAEDKVISSYRSQQRYKTRVMRPAMREGIVDQRRRHVCRDVEANVNERAENYRHHPTPFSFHPTTPPFFQTNPSSFSLPPPLSFFLCLFLSAFVPISLSWRPSHGSLSLSLHSVLHVFARLYGVWNK